MRHLTLAFTALLVLAASLPAQQSPAPANEKRLDELLQQWEQTMKKMIVAGVAAGLVVL